MLTAMRKFRKVFKINFKNFCFIEESFLFSNSLTIYLFVTEVIHGRAIHMCWVGLSYPMTMVINAIRTRLGRGLVYVLVPRQGPPSIYGVNVPADFGSVTMIPHGEHWAMLTFTYSPLSLLVDSDDDVVFENDADDNPPREEAREGGTPPVPRR